MAEAVSSSTITPTRATLSQLKNRVLRYVLAPNDNDAQSEAEGWINEAINEINLRTWQILRTSEDHTLVAGTATYTISNDYHDSRHAHLLNSSNESKKILVHLNPKEFDARFPDRSSNGTPFAYMVRNYNDTLQLELSSPPNSGFVGQYPTLRHYYYRNLQYLTSDPDRINAPAKFETFILWRARESMASVHDPIKVRYAKVKADEYWQRLVLDDNRSGFRDFT